MDMSVVILAAGKGTRMMSSLPKVLHPLGGRPVLEHVITCAKELSPSQIVVVHGENLELLKEKVGHHDLVWAHQSNPKGSGDALLSAMPYIPEHHRVLILVGDVPLISSKTLARLMHSTPAHALGVLTSTVADPTGLGRVIRDENQALCAIREERDANDVERRIHEVNAGIYIAGAKDLLRWLPRLSHDNAQKEYYLTDIVRFACQDGMSVMTALPDRVEEILGINNRVQLAQAERSYQESLAHQLLNQGVSIADLKRFDLRGHLEVGQDVSLDVNVVLEGKVVLGDRVSVGANCVLIDCEIESDVEIMPFSHLEKVKIGKKATIGPFARLRPGCIIGEQAKVGNFVEMKNTTLGYGSKAGHLSYLGDTSVGKHVNIGAGTITCNYDGKHKHKTTIKDGAFIGSGSQLVAPVIVGAHSMLAAGSTLTQDAPDEKLTLTHRLEQRVAPLKGAKNLEQSSQTLED